MKSKQLRFGKGFHLALENERSQGATMVLQPGETTGSNKNFHQGSDQWLFVVSGTGSAVVNGHRYPLRAGTLLLIEHGDKHELRASGENPMRTVNFYVPPAYQNDDKPLPAGKPGD